jgi:DNA-binding CsgD family transcriptional regulator
MTPLTNRELDVLALHRAYGLTPRELQALALAEEHQLTPREIAHVLGISRSTARRYLRNAYRKVEEHR